MEWLEQQLKDKDEMMKVLKGRLESAESHKASMESALEDARAIATRRGSSTCHSFIRSIYLYLTRGIRSYARSIGLVHVSLVHSRAAYGFI